MSDKKAPQSLCYEHVAEGQTLPELTIDVSTGLIVATALASRDYQDVHHDRDLAQQKGSKDIFMNILTTNGLVGRFITDWSGPAGQLKRVNIRLGVPNYAGDTMVLSGRVSGKQADGLIEIDVQGSNSLGAHVTGSVSLVLPYENQ